MGWFSLTCAVATAWMVVGPVAAAVVGALGLVVLLFLALVQAEAELAAMRRDRPTA